MREIPEILRVRLASGATPLAHAWRLTRGDGLVRGFTDHDGDFAFDGVTFHAATGFVAGPIEKGVGFDDTARASGVLSDDALAESDLEGGLWDGARVDIWRVDWTDPALRVHVFAGRLGEVRRGEGGFAAELRGLAADCEAPFGRVFSRFCDADVGDARCGVDTNVAAFKGSGVVTAVADAHTFTASGLGAFADGWFTRGLLTWSGGGGHEVLAHRVAATLVSFELADGPAPTVGAAFTVTAGCDKRFATCRAKFANALNFRGFPHMPGTDAVVAGADPGQPMDGGSRVLR
jgi:uncharacterized phage protein (TIGR02218 family)